MLQCQDSSRNLPPKGTHQAKLPDQRATEEEVISSDSTQEEEAVRVFEVVDSKQEDFEVFDQLDPAESQAPLPGLYPPLKSVVTKSQLTFQILWCFDVRRTPVSSSY